MKIRTFCAAVAAASLASAAGADVLWTFNSLPSDSNAATGTTSAEIGVGTALLLSGNTATFASGNASGGSTDPDTSANDSGWNLTAWAAQGTGSGTRGAEFQTNTLGLSNVVITFDSRFSNTMSKYIQLQYDIGSGFVSSGLANNGIVTAAGGDTWVNANSFALPAAANNLASLKFRIVSVFENTALGNGNLNYVTASPTGTYSTAGTLRFDMVSVIPAPGAVALLGLGGLAIARRRR